MQSLITCSRSIPSSFESSSGVRWFGMPVLLRASKKPAGARCAVGLVSTLLVNGGGQRARLPKLSMMLPGYCRAVRAATRGGPAVGLGAHVGGAGPPVVLLHGLGGAASNWVEVAPLLVDRHRVVALDLPGHAGSAPLGPARGLQAFVDAVAGPMGALGAVPALIVGHSFGGHVAVWLAARRPELVAGLLLVAPAGIGTRTRRARAAIELSTRLRPGRLVAPLGPRLARHAWFRSAV